MANRAKFTKTEFRLALNDSDGHIGVIAGRLGISRRTVYRYLEKYPELNKTLKLERASGRDQIVELAQTKLMEGLMSIDENRVDRLLMFALRHYDTDGVPGAIDIGGLFAPDVVEYLNRQGVSVSDAVREFEDIVRAQAEKLK